MKPSLLLGDGTHRELADLLHKQGRLVVSGASNETAKAMLLSHFLGFRPQPCVLVTGSDAMRESLLHWLQFFELPASSLTPVWDAEGEVVQERLQQFLLFLQAPPDQAHAFVITREEWEADFPSGKELNDKKIDLHVGEQVHFTELFESLMDRGYRHGQDLYLSPGEYRRTGDTLDIFPVQSAHPYRLQFEFDTLEKIEAVERMDLSQVTKAGPRLEIFPAASHESTLLSRQLPESSLTVTDDQDDLELPIGRKALSFTAFPESQEHHAHLRYLSVLKFYTLTDFLNDVRDKLQQEWRLLVVTKRADELTEILKEERVAHTDHENTRPGAITVIASEEEDLLPHSLQNPDLQVALLTDREIFSLRKAGKQKGIAKLALDFITSLQPGDYVVHMDHGIGHFQGTVQKTVDDVTREYLELWYAGGDKLFVPVDQADKLSKYVHEEGQEPALTRLGTVEWKRLTERMRKETREIATELLKLYAKRAKARGHRFEEDDPIVRKFEKGFPYQETPGQLKAIQDIKQDMESDHPMDRLVCGDVGFGKTEVAMRAAFKAAVAGKQVAVIAPITILADQHYKSFQERMRTFPVKVEMLSRFRTPAEQKETLDRIRKGDTHIVIGTHRLLQEDVKFHNLGLVIIDEEQRFGVKQKEKFKEMRASVDILTLTATPIPRTLNLGLHKLRDITTITTPPPGRLPIITEVRKYSDELVRIAILHELKRDGQVFVLHNRVETIDAFAEKLRKLVPEAKFIVAHGQLKPEDLERRITQFKEGAYQVLVSSTIIENGIDLPRANTLIVNEAERFGLAQLYQLRGRVGRGKVQAFAYLLYHTQKLKEDAKKRLRAIVEACELGSGFQVAMRDLEIRGAGEILGAEQSGTMQTVGVSHYLRMLKQAVEDIRSGNGREEEEDIQPEIQLPVAAFIPSFYIPDDQEKISVYQKLAGSEDEAILEEFASDLREEYGEMPEQVRLLFLVLKLKMAARRGRVLRIRKEDEDVTLTLSPSVQAAEVMQLLSVNNHWRISGSTLKLRLALLEDAAKKSARHWIEELTAQAAALERPRKEKKKREAREEEVVES